MHEHIPLIFSECQSRGKKKPKTKQKPPKQKLLTDLLKLQHGNKLFISQVIHNAHTQPAVQLQHRRAVSTRITPPAFIPQRNAEVDHVTVRWHLEIVSHHASLMRCTPLRHWGNFSATTNFPYLWQQSRAVAKRPRPKGPTLGWLCFLWWKYLERSHICQVVWEWYLLSWVMKYSEKDCMEATLSYCYDRK